MVTRNISACDAEAPENCSVKLSDVKRAEDSYLNDENCSQGTSIPEVCIKSSSEGDMMHTFSGLYAGILLSIIVTTMLAEFSGKFLPRFFIHDYLFIYFLVVGVLLIIGGVYFKCRHQVIECLKEYENKAPNISTQPSTKERTIDLNLLVKVCTAISGFVVVFTSILEVASIFSTSGSCLGYASAVHPILRSTFILIQIYFLKHSRGILNCFGCIHSLAVLHLLATNVAVWIRNVLWEIAKDWDGALHIERNSSLSVHNSNLSLTVHTLESDVHSLNVSLHSPQHVVHYTTVCYFQVQNQEKMDMTSLQYCLQTSSIGLLWKKTNQYMYPLMAQYYFLISCCLYIMWKSNKSPKGKPNYFSYLSKGREKYSNLSCSTKGLFLGSVVLSSSIIILIISFTVERKLSIMLHSIYCVIFVLSSFSSIIGLFQIKSMYAWKTNKDIQFTRVFQTIGLASVFMFGSFNFLSSFLSFDKVRFMATFEAVSMILHGSSQYMFILLASKKKTDVSNVQRKPGLQSVVFLILCNISLWLLDCFVLWNHFHKYPELTFGTHLWSVLIRFIFPFVVFYRLHSFVSLLDIWHSIYK